MGLPVATRKQGFICFAFPDVCQTPIPSGQVPIPYPNLGQLADADQVAEAGGGRGEVRAGGAPVLLAGRSVVPSTTGDEAGSGGGVSSSPPGSTRGKAEFPNGSGTVKVHGCGVVRLGDTTRQNNGNANGTVLGGVANVLAGG
jgi:hypothetical protein